MKIVLSIRYIHFCNTISGNKENGNKSVGKLFELDVELNRNESIKKLFNLISHISSIFSKVNFGPAYFEM
jgi:hypothetical protein